MSRRKDINRLLDRLEGQGWAVSNTKSGHIKVERGGKTVILPTSPSDHRSWKNLIAELRRAGADI